VAERAEQDAYLALRIDECSQPDIESQELGRVLALEDDLIYCVSHMERNGARLDVPKMQRWSQEAQQKYEKLIMAIWKETGRKINPDSNMKDLFDHLKLAYPHTEDGKPSFEAAFLKSVAYNGGEMKKGIANPLIAMAFEARRIKSLKSKYIDKYLHAVGAGDILRYSLHQLRGDDYGTITGRFASANVNIQQVMKVEKQIEELGPDFIIRELFIPDNDAYWISADAHQIEFRLFGHYANSRDLTRAYAENPLIDFHQLVCDMIEKVRPDFGRRKAKNINFGVIYGMGKDKLRRSLGVAQAIADELMDTYHSEFPEARRLMNTAARLAETRKYVKTLIGRRRRYPTGERLHSALNAVIQGTAADYMKLKLLEVYNMRRELEIKMRMTVHDELDGDVPSPEHKERVQKVLDTQSLDLRIPLLWDVNVARNWREAA
jgi:DNA polymerase-1